MDASIDGGEHEHGSVTQERLNRITEKIIGGALAVSNVLGCGFLEKVYENALVHQLRKSGLRVQAQQPICILYDSVPVGEYVADIVVEENVLVELKATIEHHEAFSAQCLNYLKATGMPLCLLLNFGKPRLTIKRYRAAIIFLSVSVREPVFLTIVCFFATDEHG